MIYTSAIFSREHSNYDQANHRQELKIDSGANFDADSSIDTGLQPFKSQNWPTKFNTIGQGSIPAQDLSPSKPFLFEANNDLLDRPQGLQ